MAEIKFEINRQLYLENIKCFCCKAQGKSINTVGKFPKEVLEFVICDDCHQIVIKSLREQFKSIGVPEKLFRRYSTCTKNSDTIQKFKCSLKDYSDKQAREQLLESITAHPWSTCSFRQPHSILEWLEVNQKTAIDTKLISLADTFLINEYVSTSIREALQIITDINSNLEFRKLMLEKAKELNITGWDINPIGKVNFKLAYRYISILSQYTEPITWTMVNFPELLIVNPPKYEISLSYLTTMFEVIIILSTGWEYSIPRIQKRMLDVQFKLKLAFDPEENLHQKAVMGALMDIINQQFGVSKGNINFEKSHPTMVIGLFLNPTARISVTTLENYEECREYVLNQLVELLSISNNQTQSKEIAAISFAFSISNQWYPDEIMKEFINYENLIDSISTPFKSNLKDVAWWNENQSQFPILSELYVKLANKYSKFIPTYSTCYSLDKDNAKILINNQ